MSLTARPPETDAGYYLLRQAKHHHWSDQRSGGRTPTAIVVHTAESKNLVARSERVLLSGDETAERVASYGATTTRQVSWHATVDADSIIWMLPDTAKAWHAGRANSLTIGVEIACSAAVWPKADPEWVAAVLERLTDCLSWYCHRWQIPARRITASQVMAGERGLVAHSDLDPKRRSDPGRHYPWSATLDLLADKIADRARPRPPEHPSQGRKQAEAADTSGTLLVDGQPMLTGTEIQQLRELLRRQSGQSD